MTNGGGKKFPGKLTVAHKSLVKDVKVRGGEAVGGTTLQKKYEDCKL